jgi:hypothetical protein
MTLARLARKSLTDDQILDHDGRTAIRRIHTLREYCHGLMHDPDAQAIAFAMATRCYRMVSDLHHSEFPRWSPDEIRATYDATVLFIRSCNF